MITGVLQILGATGLIVGLWFPWAALISSAGLSILMFLGVCVRIKIRDTFAQSSPAFIYMLLNGWLFFRLVAERH